MSETIFDRNVFAVKQAAVLDQPAAWCITRPHCLHARSHTHGYALTSVKNNARAREQRI